MESIKKIAIIGGGASGFFSALEIAKQAKIHKLNCEIHIFELSTSFLRKVKISGGGRCNVTNNEPDINQFRTNYPRGQRELKGPFRIFSAKDTIEWFESRGVKIVAEKDNRMFPKSNSSQTIIDCFHKEAVKNNVKLQLKTKVEKIKKENGKYILAIKDKPHFCADALVMATGSSKSGYEISKDLGHSLSEMAPSLFTFKIRSEIFKELSGISFPNVTATLKPHGLKKKFVQTGPLLITHWGVSGPCILKLSAFAAREMKNTNYKANLYINWAADKSMEDIQKLIMKLSKTKLKVSNTTIDFIPKRFWLNLLHFVGIDQNKFWREVSKKEMNVLVENLYHMELNVTGQNRFKEEFVECGGISSKEVNFQSMESKISPNLYFAGEILDIDGITGGFNFQNAWTTAHIAGINLVEKLVK